MTAQDSTSALIQTLNGLRTKIDAAKAKQERKRGEYDAAVARLKNEFGATSLTHARELLAKMEADEAALIDNLRSEISRIETELAKVTL